MKSLLVGIKNVVLWSYARGTWQYDLLCLLIIAGVFLIPSRYFGDRDRAVQAYDPREVASKAGVSHRLIDLDELQAFLKKTGHEELAAKPREALARLLRDQLQRDVKLVEVEPLTSAAGLRGYRVRFE
jgi:hypothetical protein